MMRELIERTKASNKPLARGKASPLLGPRRKEPRLRRRKIYLPRGVSLASLWGEAKRPTLPEVERALRAKYHLRYNVLTCRTEYRAVDATDDVPYLPVTKRVYKTWLCELQADGTDFWWMGGIEAVAESMHVEEYHPVMAYFDALPQWDGEDRLTPLMRRLTKDDTMVGYLCRWMLAFVHQARGGDAVFANSVAPLLISDRQGLHKSTFCRLLLPETLRHLYTDSFDLSAEGQCQRKLADCLLINLDEFDRYSPRKQSLLKNLMQMTTLSVRRAYERNASVLPRIASFIGTSNSDALLSDPTGSRRFLCIEIDESIDVETPIEYAQLYAQCIAMLERGERHHFIDEEVRDIELRNRGFRRSLPLEELFFAHYRLPREGEEPLLLSAAEIYDTLYDIDPRTMRGVCRQNFGAELRSFGAKRRKHHERRVYEVKLRGEGIWVEG